MLLSDAMSEYRHNNNFNLIRVLASIAVLISHGTVLIAHDDSFELLRRETGMSLGSMAVDVFFVTSGYLVTASMLRSRSLVDFASSRVLRIYPALLVMLLVTVSLVGLFFTALSPQAFLFSGPQVWIYLVKGATLVRGVDFSLPGAFLSNPLTNALNGSLWTLPYEVKMYILVACIWIAASRFRHIESMFNIVCVMVWLAFGLFFAVETIGARHDTVFDWPHLGYAFFCGALFFVFRNRIVLNGWMACALAGAIALCTGHAVMFQLAFPTFIGYITLTIAYRMRGWWLNYNRVGDYSYGIYLYAFAIQQMVIAMSPGITALRMNLIAMLLTLLCAVVSWHVVEKPALGWRKRRVVSNPMVTPMVS